MPEGLTARISRGLTDARWICPECDAETREALRALMDEYRFERPAGHIAKFEGDEARAVYLVQSGWLLASKSMEDGQRQIIDIVLPGELLEPASADPGMSRVEVQALTAVDLAVIPRKEWRRACHEHADLSRLGHRSIRSAFSRISGRMLRLGKGTAENMMAYALFELCLRSTGQAPIRGKAFHIPMTQQQLGDYCGLSAVHICRTLRRLERNGILEVSGHMDITVGDVDTLAEIAEIDPAVLQQEIMSAA